MSTEYSAPNPAPPTHVLNVMANTWQRESQDLFDFESEHVTSSAFTLHRSATIIRDACAVCSVDDSVHVPVGAAALLRIVSRSGRYWIDRAGVGTSLSKMWAVVRDAGSPAGHHLAKDDVIRLGRFKFRVRQLVTEQDGDQPPNLGLEDTSMDCAVADSIGEGVAGKVCRICLMEGATAEDPLIRPCKCMGSIERVHLGCLREWTKNRLHLDSVGPTGSFSYRPMPCELCKATFPTYITTADGERSTLLDLPRTKPPYIVLEGLVRETQQVDRSVHVMSVAGKSLTLGRAHESDLRIADVSISRCHAVINCKDGQFYIQDNCSKFGTLVAIRRPRPIEPSKPISVQIGHTVLSFSLSPIIAPDAMLLSAMASSLVAAATSQAAALDDAGADGTSGSISGEAGRCVSYRMSF